MDFIYLDNNATTRPAPEVIAAMQQALIDLWANPSSIHRAGQAVRRRVELARQSVAKLVGCTERDLVFTSGGTEAANLAIMGSLHAFPERRVLVTSQIEHSAIRAAAGRLTENGCEVVWLPVDEDGLVDVSALSQLLKKRAGEIALVSVMWCNNETGVIQPIEQIGALCQQHGVRFYTDGTQWVGKMPVDVSRMPIDLLSFASHKFHGPKGIGALYIKPRTKITPQTVGGPQERQRRGGTENVPGILGLGVAADLAHQWLQTSERDRINAMRQRLERDICSEIEGALVNGANAPRNWNTSNIAFTGLETEAILLLLSEKGVCASGGSACASGSLETSPVLTAMNLSPDRANGSVRFSLCRDTTDAEIDRAVEIVVDVVSRLRSLNARVISQNQYETTDEHR
jgi:cysteine desulfurase